MVRRRYQRDENRIGKICISMILIVFVVVMSVKIVQLYQKDQTYIEQQAERQSELDAELERQEELKEYESYTGTQEYIEQQANKQGIVYDNQIIFKETDD